MRKLVVCNIMSLDGYYEGPGKNVMVLSMDASFDAYNLERIRAADTVLLGRKSYEAFSGFWPAMADDADATEVHREFAKIYNKVDKVVVTDTFTPEPDSPWHDTTTSSHAPARRTGSRISSSAPDGRFSHSRAERCGTTSWPKGWWTNSISSSAQRRSATAPRPLLRPYSA
jgi:hypothetical protein